jgi:hypothetical protein
MVGSTKSTVVDFNLQLTSNLDQPGGDKNLRDSDFNIDDDMDNLAEHFGDLEPNEGFKQ